MSPERDANFYTRCCAHVLMPFRKQNTYVNASDALKREYLKGDCNIDDKYVLYERPL